MKNLGIRKCAPAFRLGVPLLAILLVASKPSAAQTAAVKPLCVGCSVDGKTTPRTADGHPDLNGYWGGGGGAPAAPPVAATSAEGLQPGQAGYSAPVGATSVIQRTADRSILYDPSTEYNEEVGGVHMCLDEAKCQVPNQPPYNAKYMVKVKAIAASEFGGSTSLDPREDCRPAGVPRQGIAGQIVQTPAIIAILMEAAPYSTYRIVYMDGRPHPDMKEYETTYFGDSIGHWDGDTLVIDTIGFNDDTWVGGGGPIGTVKYTSIHSEKMHVIERVTRVGDELNYEVTVEDPDAFTRPWVLAPRKIRHAGPGMEVPGEDAVTENICTATNKDHYVKPDPEDRDIKQQCAYRCEKGVK